jgi:starch synthase
MKLFHISAECYPVAKSRRTGRCSWCLPKYQTQQKHNVGVVIPNYGNSFFDQKTLKSVYSGSLTLGEKSLDYKILKEKKSTLGFTLYLIDIPELFGRPNVYGYPDDTERFTAFQIAFLDWLVATKNIPKIIHCHDHHTGLIPFMVKHAFKYEILKDIPSIITIHNAQYQGSFSFEKLNYLPPFDLSHIGLLEWNNTINPLATAIKCAWKITTVSSSYLDEMSFSANGLEDLLRHEKSKSIGILNGIDTEVWNPETDEMIEKNFSLQNYKEGKATNKKVLCKRFNLDDTKPLFVFIGRLVGEKGADLLPNICRIAFLDYLNKINILILGSGSAEVEESLENLKVFYKTNYNVYIGYNEQLSHQIYVEPIFY